MTKNQGKTGVSKDAVVRAIPIACSNEQAAVEFFEAYRWGDSPCCPNCESRNVYQMTDRKTGDRNKRFLWRCKGCNKQYTVRTGTVMEDSRIPIRHWTMACWLACSSKKGCSAMQIQRMTGVTYKSALFLMHRIRWAMSPVNAAGGGKLKGIVECDESFVGGKPRYPQTWIPKPYRQFKMKRGPHHKQPVFGAVERDGRVRARVIPDVTGKTLKAAVLAHVDKSSKLMTDDNTAYKAVGKEFLSHDSVGHSRREYVRGDVTTNTIESFWAILKRGIFGVYHNVSRKHLQRYLDEFEFRYNTRKLTDGERTVALIQGTVGKKLVC